MPASPMKTIGQGFVGHRPGKEPPPFWFYGTPPEAIERLLDYERAAIKAHGDRVWEPACGRGNLVGPLERAMFQVVATDINEDCRGQGGRNFLDEKELLAPSIVTNPPFTLAVPFFFHALELGAGYIALLGKAQWWHAQDRDRVWKAWRPARIYAITWRLDFEGKGQAMMDCSWTIWDRHAGTVPKTEFIRLTRKREAA
jgi:hypothetical protein